jgi:hypothetical protein
VDGVEDQGSEEEVKSKRPVSRIDTDDTHGFLARVYRARVYRDEGKWSKGKMFSDGVYGGRDIAERAAWDWQKRVDRALPVIRPKPVLKVASFSMRKDSRGRYYAVYLPQPGRAKHKVRCLYFNNIQMMESKAKIANKLVSKQNAILEVSYRLALAAWKKEREKTLAEIDAMWLMVKERSLNGRSHDRSPSGSGTREIERIQIGD